MLMYFLIKLNDCSLQWNSGKKNFKFFSLTKTKKMETLIYLILYTKANSKNLKSGRGYLEDTA